MPVLFARCFAHPGGQKGIPPVGIRPYVQHLTYINHSQRVSDSDSEDSVSTHEGPSVDIPFGLELKYLPAIRSVSFRCTLRLSHLELMNMCLACPTLTSIIFTNAVRWCGGYPDPRVDSPYPPHIGITHLQHSPSVWREISCDLERRNISAEIALESHCLALIALAINNTAEVLSMPVESAPMARMSELSWPRLREVALCGRYILPSQSTCIPRLLAHAPRLRKLSIQVAQPYTLRLSRAPILSRKSTPDSDLTELEELIIAYPDPDDAIFSVSAPNITHLSLRDWPRYYFYQDVVGVVNRWAAPLLTAAECLHILKRMSLHHLTNLELAYRVDQSDDTLLRYIASSFPKLTRLELHRYRSGEELPYKDIVKCLASIQTLRVLHLNLDWPDMTGPRSSSIKHVGESRHNRWIAAARTRGLEVVDILEPHCLDLECACLLIHESTGSYWWKFRPSRYPGKRVGDNNRSDAEVDFEPLPLPWGKRG
ncbi:hypothetical protein C8Q74DRAFT_1303147 [Fomes fomentarius]|nr:hypothetical protein C8Q74DRAFT_1303147 [Fomes fomentarius]